MVNLLRVMSGKMANGGGNCPTGGGARRYPGPVLLALFLISALPALSDPLTFTGDTLITLSSGAQQTGVDLSGLQFGNTADGMEISGILAVAFPDTGGVLTVGVLEIVSERFFVAPLGTDVTPLAHANGMYVNNEGGLWMSSIGVSTFLNPHPSQSGPCGAGVGVDVGDFRDRLRGAGHSTSRPQRTT